MSDTTNATPETAAPTTQAPARPSRAASRIAARLASEPVPDADSASDADGASPPADASGSESASGEASDETAAGSSPAAPDATTPPEAPTPHDLLQEKLEKARAENRERRERAEAKRIREEAERYAAERTREADSHAQAMAAERAKWERLGKEGTYKDVLAELGRDPRVEFEALQREAIEAGTPEAIAKRQAAEWERKFKEAIGPLQERLEQLAKRDEELTAREREMSFRSDYAEAVKAGGEKYWDLLDAESEDKVVGKALALAEHPETFHQWARHYKVRLTAPGGRYNMTDILNVLAAAQAEYDAGRANRRAARTPPTPPSETATAQAAPSTPTVNGTAAPRNAGTQTIGNDLATARAGDGKFVAGGRTAAQRLRERARQS